MSVTKAVPPGAAFACDRIFPMRKHYIDNLRSLAILILIPYHAAMAWNTWGEPNYMMFGQSRILSSLIVFFSPFLMPLLFVLAGISTKYALGKRTAGQYVLERVKRLIVPLLFGTLAFMPVMAYLADRYNCRYEGTFFGHYKVFFTKFTDLTGADGGFSFGQFWFLLYLFVISLICLGIIMLQKKLSTKAVPEIPLWLIVLTGLPIPLISGFLEVNGKSIVLYAYIFLIGYYVLSNDKAVEMISRFRFVFLAMGLGFDILNIWLFLWSGASYDVLNGITNDMTTWFMMLALTGLGNAYLDKNGKLSSYMSARSFAFFSLHYICLVVMQYLMSGVIKGNTAMLFAVPVAASYVLTFLITEAFVRIPVLSFLTGVKPLRRER